VTGRNGFPKPHRAVAAGPVPKKTAQGVKPKLAPDSDVAKLADKLHANA
jgi:hypothetical protein